MSFDLGLEHRSYGHVDSESGVDDSDCYGVRGFGDVDLRDLGVVT